MKAMIFAAGLGTRLKPLTDHMPKALVPVAGVPLLEIQIRKMIAAGVTDIVINVHHFADQIRNFIRENQSFGIRISFSDETEQLLETGGAVKKASSFFQDTKEPFLVHNVDILSNADLSSLMQHSRQAAAALLVSKRDTQRYLLFDAANRLVGWTNIQTEEVRSPYPHLNPDACQRYAFSGIQMISPALFPLMSSWPEKFSIIDFYLSVCDKVCIRAYPDPDLKLMDVGKINTLPLADEFYRNNV